MRHCLCPTCGASLPIMPPEDGVPYPHIACATCIEITDVQPLLERPVPGKYVNETSTSKPIDLNQRLLLADELIGITGAVMNEFMSAYNSIKIDVVETQQAPKMLKATLLIAMQNAIAAIEAYRK